MVNSIWFQNNSWRIPNWRDGGASHRTPEISHEDIGGNRCNETLVEQATRHRGFTDLRSRWSGIGMVECKSYRWRIQYVSKVVSPFSSHHPIDRPDNRLVLPCGQRQTRLWPSAERRVLSSSDDSHRLHVDLSHEGTCVHHLRQHWH